MKEFGPPGRGGARPWRPSLDTPMNSVIFQHLYLALNPDLFVME